MNPQSPASSQSSQPYVNPSYGRGGRGRGRGRGRGNATGYSLRQWTPPVGTPSAPTGPSTSQYAQPYSQPYSQPYAQPYAQPYSAGPMAEVSVGNRGRGRGRGTRAAPTSRESPASPSSAYQRAAQINPEILRSYFGTRHGITFEEAHIREGVNYTPETLRTMTPYVRADEISQAIVSRLPSPITIVETCGGLGGTALAFLDDPKVAAVYTYEPRENYRRLLQNNLQAYKFTNAQVFETPFAGVPANLTGAVLYMDPAWIVVPSTAPITGATEATREPEYQLSGLRLGPYTLEEWMAQCKHCALVAIRLPLGYQLQPVPGWTCERIDKRKYQLTLCRPEGAAPALPAPEVATVDTYAWREQIRARVHELLAPIMDPDQLEIMTSDQALQTWEKAFTNETFNPVDNYEELEILGDAVLKLTFVQYLLRRFPGITKNKISALLDRYMSKLFQQELAQNLGFGSLIRVSNVKTTKHIMEDTFESFFGALFDIANTLIADGLGYIFSYGLLAVIFEPVQFNMAYAYGRSKTQIKEFFEGLGWGVPTETVMNTDVGVLVVISLTPAAQRYLAERGLIVPRDIGAAEAATKKVAMHGAYDNAMETLARAGITREWVLKEKEDWEFSNPDYLPYLERAREKLRREGYAKMYFFTPRSGTTVKGCLVQLIGVQRDTNRHVQLVSIPNCEVEEGKVEALRQFVEGR
jgi:hypothetical protein